MALRNDEKQFHLDDFLKQMNQVRKLGPLQNIIGMLPGMGQIKDQLKDLDLNSKEVRRIECHHYIYDGSRARESKYS